MATTSVTTSSSAADIAAANKAAAQKLITSLNAGSGVDVASLAKNLVDAEKVPQQNAINAKITKNESRISGYSAVSFVLSELNTAFTALKDQSNFNSIAGSSSQPGAFSATASTTASTGNHEVEVLQIAKAQRSVSAGFSAPTAALNAGLPMRLSFRMGATDTTTPLVTTQQGSGGVTETSTLTFKDLAVGQSVRVGGLTYTATQASSAAEVAAAFAGLSASANTPAQPAKGTFSGALSGFNANANAAGSSLTFTSTTALSDVTDLEVSSATVSITLAVGKDTPQDIADAINAAKIGVTANIVNTGDGSAAPYQMVLNGNKGAEGAFTWVTEYTAANSSISTSPSVGANGLVFSPGHVANQTATDARIKVDGITFTRNSNTFSDVLKGVTFDVKGVTTGGAATLALSRDATVLKEKFQSLVQTYNDAMSMLNVVSDPKSTVETYGATLVGDSTVRSIKGQLRGLIQGVSDTPGSNISAMWQLGVSVDQNGVMSLDESKFDTALTNHFDDVVKTMTGNTNGLSAYSSQPAGFAGAAFRKISKLLSPTGPIYNNSQNAETQNAKYQEQLTKLDVRMSNLLSRYTKQFSAMESLVGSVNSQKTSLKSTFEGMMAAYTNK